MDALHTEIDVGVSLEFMPRRVKVILAGTRGRVAACVIYPYAS